MSKFRIRSIDPNEDVRAYLRYLVRELTHVLENIDEENMTEEYINSIKEEER